MFSLDICTTSQ